MFDHSLELIERIGDKQITGVEVGTYKGENARLLLEHCPNLELYLVDIWDTSSYTTPQDKLYGINISKAKEEVYRLREEYIIRCKIINLPSILAADRFKPIDFVFIDADHSYLHTVQDIRSWTPLCTKWIGGHDFSDEFPGVQAAVREYFNIFEIGKGTTWFYDKTRCY